MKQGRPLKSVKERTASEVASLSRLRTSLVMEDGGEKAERAISLIDELIVALRDLHADAA